MNRSEPRPFPTAVALLPEAAVRPPLTEERLGLEERAAQLQALAAAQSRTEHRARRRLARRLHDQLQQLLVAARLQTSLARRRVVDEELLQTLDQVDQLLDESIEVSRSLTMELCPPVLYDMGLTAALEWLVRDLAEKHQFIASLQAQADDEPTRLESRVVLFEAVRELLMNVIRHAGTRQARVILRRRAPRHVEIVVSDAGRGFALAELPWVARTGRFGLLGIRERLEFLGGKLELESAPGRGTRATLLVPRTARLRAHQRSLAFSPPSDGLATRRRVALDQRTSPKIRLLLVDDHAVVREGIANFLLDEPDLEIVAEAGDGQEAIELALGTRPDVILMDVTMPQMDGIEATRRIKAQLPQVRIIGLSMHEREDLASAMYQAGASAYLSKNGCADTLVSTIRGIPTP